MNAPNEVDLERAKELVDSVLFTQAPEAALVSLVASKLAEHRLDPEGLTLPLGPRVVMVPRGHDYFTVGHKEDFDRELDPAIAP